MPRQKNTRPTSIYWLYDTRPEIVAVFGPEGQPFYCGKTIQKIERRLNAHKWSAPRDPLRPVYARLLEVGDNVATILTEVVPTGESWSHTRTLLDRRTAVNQSWMLQRK